MLQIVKRVGPERVVRTDDVLEGRYKLLQIIGEGGMGTVFLAEHVLIKRRVAIKVLHPDLARDADVVERFMNEARAAGTLGHPNIVESTDMGFARNEVPYIVFEYLEGALLSDEIYRLGGLTPRRALKIAHQMASALEAAHRAGIIHRDLKSDNVFLTDKDDKADHVKVLDFGISRFQEAGQHITASKRPGQVMGTPEFMAPEQITSPDNVDARADIYGLGVVLYEMLAARTPFTNDNKDDPHELLHKIVLDRPPAISRQDLPAGLADMLFDRLLAKDPDVRYQTMGDVQSALEAFMSVMQRDTRPIVAPASLQAPAADAAAAAAALTLAPALPAAPRRRPSRLWLVAAILVGAAGAALLAAPAETTLSPAGKASVTELERDAEQLARALDGAASATELRAQGIATSPLLRAAIETDAATLQDLARDANVFDPRPGEAIEIFQQRDTAAVSLLRLPAGAPPIVVTAQRPRLVAEGGHSAIVVTAPILRQANTVGGSLALAAPVDLREILGRIGTHAISARLVGQGVDLTVADGRGTGTERTIELRTKVGALSLVAVVANPIASVESSQPFMPIAYACFALGALCALVFFVAFVRR